MINKTNIPNYLIGLPVFKQAVKEAKDKNAPLPEFKGVARVQED